MKNVAYKLKLAEPNKNKCSSCAKFKRDYLQKRAQQHEKVKIWLQEKLGKQVRIIRSDGKTAVIVIEAREGMKTFLETAPDVVEVR